MTNDSGATKARILEAAYREFAAYGLAGSRIDRIAENAKANKRAIYEYFGKKEDLFDHVVTERLSVSLQTLPSSFEDLPQFAGAVFDYYASDPDRVRLTLWRQLERPTPIQVELDYYQQRLPALAAAQPGQSLSPADLYAVIWTIHHVQALTPLSLQIADSGAPWSAERWQQLRAAVVTAVSRITQDHTSQP
ncbi:TetR family transcriptional regulator [Actinacidiphila glaucinigra]|uniref:TetR/AcrR family transcriptional regulator n=1 Tax=Actinacidiphila glaucinigra TaxID=235986 RepID=UPI002DD90AC9|nr:TetR family transcriptional regulator [Actinacidiphila glaucinigra]WSD64793.1 TetR family transcriptional regulator [Actinacidiphila glaucinigra]